MLPQKKELLVIWRANRNNHPATVPQLVDQRLGDMIRSAGHDDSVERRMFRPALVAIARKDFYIVISEAFQICFCPSSQWLNDFDCEDLRYQS